MENISEDYLPPIKIDYLNAVEYDLIGNEYKVWSYLLEKCYLNGSFGVSPADIMKVIKISESTYRRTRASLIEKGYLKLCEESIYEFIPCPEHVLENFYECSGKTYSVYKFTFPNGKIYIGQTGQRVQNRWNYGTGYKNQDVYEPIKEYGWDNVKKEILAEDISKKEAGILERYYINFYHSVENGYNRR